MAWGGFAFAVRRLVSLQQPLLLFGLDHVVHETRPAEVLQPAAGKPDGPFVLLPNTLSI